ncbi:MAG: hypothetical protein AAGE59_34525 [Cyanobacteria bacterium P01_F01_bin.86]
MLQGIPVSRLSHISGGDCLLANWLGQSAVVKGLSFVGTLQ